MKRGVKLQIIMPGAIIDTETVRAGVARALGRAARRRRRDLRVPADDVPLQGDDRGRVHGLGRIDQFRRPLVSSQRRGQPQRLRRGFARSRWRCSSATGARPASRSPNGRAAPGRTSFSRTLSPFFVRKSELARRMHSLACGRRRTGRRRFGRSFHSRRFFHGHGDHAGDATHAFGFDSDWRSGSKPSERGPRQGRGAHDRSATTGGSPIASSPSAAFSGWETSSSRCPGAR